MVEFLKVYQKIFLMPDISRISLVLVITLILASCSKKVTPTTTNPTSSIERRDTLRVEMEPDTIVEKKVDSVVVKKPVVKRKVKETIPNVIVVNDKVASKSVDGRLYYDLNGRRYWRNYKDGKYYLFNKSMNTDDAFKKPD